MNGRDTAIRSFLIVGASAVVLISLPVAAGQHAFGPTSAGQWTQATQLGENLVGKAVYTRDGVEAGEVEKILRGENQQVVGIVISVGGILGLGARQVLVRPDEVEVRREGERTTVYLDVDKKGLDARAEMEGGNLAPKGNVK